MHVLRTRQIIHGGEQDQQLLSTDMNLVKGVFRLVCTLWSHVSTLHDVEYYRVPGRVRTTRRARILPQGVGPAARVMHRQHERFL